MRKFIFIFLTILLCNSCLVFANSENLDFLNIAKTNMNNKTIPNERKLPRFVDTADLLEKQEESELTKKLDNISESQKCDVIIITVSSLDGKTPKDYADDFFDYNGYGYGEQKDGILLLISMQGRDWAISTYNKGEEVFSNSVQADIINEIKPYLSQNDFNKAFNEFAKSCSSYIKDFDEEFIIVDGTKKRVSIVLPHIWIIYSLGVGAVIALIVTLILKGQLKSIKKQNNADNYVRSGSLQLSESRDVFLYSHITKTAKPKDNDSHTSSSGRSHGGSSGKF